ncbi:30S ribosomal protein S20 [Patescibacteria group bacterium]|nr:30S ribosomal protein S20 [Patescibacteria group bacterium]
MPITKSAKKALRQSQRRRVRNIQRKKKIKDLIKEVRNLVAQKKITEAQKLLPQVYKALDKAARVGTIKKNTASRKKSCLSKLLKLSD